MNLSKINEISNSEMSNETKRVLILTEISKDEGAATLLLNILESERKRKNALVVNLNELLSKAYAGLTDTQLNKDEFIQKEIADFYKESEVKYCFNKLK